MAKWHYDLSGAEPIIRDVPVYDSSDIAKGEFLMLEKSDENHAQYQTGYVGGSTEMVEALGISLETLTTTHVADYGDRISTAATTSTPAIASIANTVTEGNTYGKAIINPFAIYLTERDQTSGGYITCVATSNSTTVTDTVEQDFDGGWLYTVPAAATVAANGGQLRYITVEDGSGDTYTLLTAWTTTTGESLIKIVPIGHEFIALDDTGQMTSDTNAHTIPDEVSLRCVENYIGGTNRPLEPLRSAVHNGIRDVNAKFYSDIVLKDHIFNSMA